MTGYLVESYSPRNQALTESDARIAISVLAISGITHLASILLPEDETCFHIFEADDRDIVAGISETAGLSPLRIVEIVHSGHWG